MTDPDHAVHDPLLTWGQGGAGAPLVCLHGLGDRKEAFRHCGPLLARRDHRVLAVDAPGHGGSTRPTPQSSMDVAVALEEVVDSLGEICILVAHSAAAAPAAAVAVSRPELVLGLILISPVLDTEADSWVQKIAGHTVMRWMPLWMLYYRAMFPRRRPADLNHHMKAVRDGLRGRMGAVAGYFRERQDLTARMNHLRGRHLAIIGDADPSGVTMQSLTRVLQEITPQAEWEVQSVPGAGHCPHQDSPAVVSDLIHAFISCARGS